MHLWSSLGSCGGGRTSSTSRVMDSTAGHRWLGPVGNTGLLRCPWGSQALPRRHRSRIAAWPRAAGEPGHILPFVLCSPSSEIEMGERSVGECWNIHPDRRWTAGSERPGPGPRPWCQLIQYSGSVSASVLKCWELLLTTWKPLLTSAQYFNALLYCSDISKTYFLKIRVWEGKSAQKTPTVLCWAEHVTGRQVEPPLSTVRKAFVLRTRISGNVVTFDVFSRFFLISHTLCSADTQALLLHLATKASHNTFVSVVD